MKLFHRKIYLRNIFNLKSLKRSLSIIELTIAIAVLGIMTGISLHYGVRYHKQSIQNADSEKIKVIQKALKSYFKQNRRLPKPTDYTVAQNSDAYGKEKSTTTGDISFDSDIYTSQQKRHIVVSNKNKNVPEIYRQVEYIQSSGTQWINTGVYPIDGDNTEIEIQFLMSDTSSGYYPTIFGTRAGNHHIDQFVFMKENDRYFFRFECGSDRDYGERIQYVQNQKYTLKWSNKHIQLNDNIYSASCRGKTTSSYPLALFTLNDGGDYNTWHSASATKRIYYAKIKTNNTLVRDFIPVYRKSDNVAGLYDVVNNVFYSNINGSSNFSVGEPQIDVIIDQRVYDDDIEAPDEYQRVEYIEGTGTQWIDLDYTVTTNTRVQFKYIYTHCNGGGFIRKKNSSSDTTDWRFFLAGTNCNTAYFDAGNNSGRIVINNNFTLNHIYETEIGKYYIKDLTTGNIVGSSSSTSYDTGGNISLFGGNDYGKIYYIKIYEGDELKREYIPVYRKSNNATGLYEVKNEVFYPNNGTGEFRIGSNIYNPKIENIKQNIKYTIYRGIVPFKELNLSEKDVVDMQGNYFEYYVPEIMTLEQNKSPTTYDTNQYFIKSGYNINNSSGDYSEYNCPANKNSTPDLLCDKKTSNVYGVEFYDNPNKERDIMLPYGFQRVEYIESNSQQSINTRARANHETTITMDIQFNNINNQYNGYFISLRNRFDYGIYGNKFFFYYGITSGNGYQNVNSSFTADTNRHKITYDVKNQSMTFDGLLIYAVDRNRVLATFDGADLYLFDRNISTDHAKISAKLYWYTMYKNENIIRNFVPCYLTNKIVKENSWDDKEHNIGEIGLYDTVENRFYANSTTTPFSKGKNINNIKYIIPPYGLRVKDLEEDTFLDENGSIAYVIVGHGSDGLGTCALHRQSDITSAAKKITTLSSSSLNSNNDYQKYSAQNCFDIGNNSMYNIIGRSEFGSKGKEITFYKGGSTKFFDDKVEYATISDLIN